MQILSFRVGNALNIPFGENEYDLATLLHVGMNIPDKNKLFSEVSRVLNKGGSFAIYETMIVAEGDFLNFQSHGLQHLVLLTLLKVQIIIMKLQLPA